MKILHTADIHIGYETHGKLDASTGLNSRLLDFEKCFQEMVQKGLDEKIDLFLFVGDAYRDAHPSPTEQRIFSRALKPIIDANIPIVMIVGNHDHPVAFGKSNSIEIFSNLIDDVILFSKPESKDIETKSGKVRVVGLPWPQRSLLYTKHEHQDKNPEEIRDAMKREYLDFISEEAMRIQTEKINYPTILAAHLHVDTAQFTEGSEKMLIETRDPVFSVDSLAHPAFDYVALGHIHRYQNLNQGKTPPVVYSGSIERVSFAEWQQPKGFVIVEFDSEKRARYSHIQTQARKFFSFDDDLSSLDMSIDVNQYLQEKLLQLDFTDAVIRLRFNCTAIQKAQVNFSFLRDLLKSASSIAELRFTVEKETIDSTNSPRVTLSDSVETALERFIERKGTGGLPKDKIMEAARNLENQSY
ncbi:MAG: exonuclease SbcCD subunit D [Chloroherpetonaceae bacterium]|nr:exonuclease SbcCD subunit D [Chloroherpetonaceae bacterium]